MFPTPRSLPLPLLMTIPVALVACGGTSDFVFPTSGEPGSPSTDAGVGAPSEDAGTVTTNPPDSPDASVSAPDATVATPSDASVDASVPVPDAMPVELYPPDAGDILSGLKSITSKCAIASNGKYATDRQADAGVDICKLNGAYFWTADMGIDCDGQKTTQCNSSTDPSWEAPTSIDQSNGQPLISSALPWVVVPLPSSKFDYTKENIKLGALAIVLYGDQVAYGIIGDEGPTGMIGEASYAMAASLGIDPTPRTGGTAGAVTYIVLTGTGAVVSPVESHAAATTLASTLVPQLILAN